MGKTFRIPTENPIENPNPLEEAAWKIVQSLLIVGRNPHYHYDQTKYLRRHWPTLWRAINSLVDAFWVKAGYYIKEEATIEGEDNDG